MQTTRNLGFFLLLSQLLAVFFFKIMAKRDEQVKKFDEKLNVESKYGNERADTTLSKTTNEWKRSTRTAPHTH